VHSRPARWQISCRTLPQKFSHRLRRSYRGSYASVRLSARGNNLRQDEPFAYLRNLTGGCSEMVENSNSAYSPSRRPIAHPRAARVIPGGLFTVQKQTPAPMFTRAGVAPLLLFLFVTLAQRTSLSAARLPLL